MSDMLAFQQPIVFYGKLNALSQTLLKLTSPGVPDIYQGTELWDLSLVDPDNRRPVDYVQRQQLLSALTYKENGSADQTRTLPELDYNADEGDIKLYMMSKALGLGSEQPELFANGHYEPLTAEGPHSNHVCAFFRHLHGSSAIVAVPRLFDGLLREESRLPLGEDVWNNTSLLLPTDLQNTVYKDVFSGMTIRSEDGRLRLAEVFRQFHLPY